jgi:iron complex outermembrane receptor protein
MARRVAKRGRADKVEGPKVGVTLAITAMGALAAMAGPVVTPARASISREQRLGWVQSYDIPSGPMATALNTFAYVNGLHLAYEARVTESLRTEGLAGAFSMKEGLDRLLRGTGLGYRFSDNGRSVSIILAQNDGVRSDAGGAEALPPIDVGAENARPNASARGPRSAEPKIPSEGYVVTNAATATKTDVPLKQTPASVQVVPKQLIRDQAVTNLSGALENVSGVRSNNDAIGGYLFKIRGFDSYDVYRNLLNSGSAYFSGSDMANIERIEVLKGPASVLFGRGEPGGLINLVTKTPLSEPRFVVEQQIGNYDHYRTQWDFSAPVAEVPGLAWRLSGAYQENKVFRQFDDASRVMVAPVVTYRPSDWTELTVDLQYFGNQPRVLSGIPVVGSAPANVPHWRSYQEPNDPRDRTDSFVGSYVFRQNLDENWKVTNRFLYSSLWYSQSLVAHSGLSDDLTTLDRYAQAQNTAVETYSTNFDVQGKFETFGARHIFLFGLDYMNKLNDYYWASDGGSYPIDIYSPVYGTVPSSAFYNALLGVGAKFHSSTLNRQKGLYVQDHVTFLDDRVHVLLGVRYDVADVTSAGVFTFGGDTSASKAGATAQRLASPSRTDTGWSPRFGLVYDLTPEVSVYGSFTRSFGANNSTTGQAFPPQRGTQWEVGVKTQILPELTATLAFFQLTKSNLTTLNYATLDPSDTNLAGLQRSRGIELDILGRVTERLTVSANYAHIDAKVISDNPMNRLNPYGLVDPAIFGAQGGLLGAHLDNVPRHSGKIFATYDFGDDGLGWRVGGGVTAAASAWGDIQNTFVIPAWARLDAFASYTTLFEGHRVTAQLNLNNITNARYFYGADILFNVPMPRLSAYPAQPFTVVGKLAFEW